ncbi:TPA: hypothetical protein ACYUXY_004679, partial [Escherichia coli]
KDYLASAPLEPVAQPAGTDGIGLPYLTHLAISQLTYFLYRSHSSQAFSGSMLRYPRSLIISFATSTGIRTVEAESRIDSTYC